MVSTLAAGATPTPIARPACDTSVSSLYCVYTIQPGDTLSVIANNFGLTSTADVTAAELLVNSNKPDIVSDDDILQVGQKLRIPTAPEAIAQAAVNPLATPAPGQTPTAATTVSTKNAVIHTVTSTQTLSDIASQYGVSVDDIVAANNIANPDQLQIGDELLIPDPKQFAQPTPVAAAASPSSGGSSGATSSSADVVANGPRSASGLIWPVTGPISSYFGPSHPLGIDIDLYANPRSPIGAAMAGTVSFAGGDPCCSYGYYVVVDHANGYQTLYAHFSQILVTVGQQVAQGQELGISGCTGYCTGPHLHFEVHVNGQIVNPLAYLP